MRRETRGHFELVVPGDCLSSGVPPFSHSDLLNKRTKEETSESDRHREFPFGVSESPQETCTETEGLRTVVGVRRDVRIFSNCQSDKGYGTCIETLSREMIGEQLRLT